MDIGSPNMGFGQTQKSYIGFSSSIVHPLEYPGEKSSSFFLENPEMSWDFSQLILNLNILEFNFNKCIFIFKYTGR
jgi:hypothetical protein